MNKILQFFKDEADHWITSRLEAMKYGLEHDITKLEKVYNETKSERIWFTLEMKRHELVNVSARLADRRMKS
ncbi:hypothetical protein [Candidatus Nitrosotenuis sp. DW1]|uniref:hypothetical protein n=1 Tax=Candidatus Nitrosotenuis sp. DW1 TaxID=2259672 RepID=UPI0015CAE5C6|nr:hypothetical protein [Candidatus Nitrosotenuis sp. DW1]QLH09439.1 hypothetical protein DSQ19_08110 [Candidatus Nitrosotenuis sp. DW1]